MSHNTPQTPIVQSYTEWDPLEEVIVGSVQGAVYPPYGPILAAHGDPRWLLHYQGTLVEEELVDLAHEQLETLVEVLKAEGVTVRRPAPIPHNIAFETPFWSARSGWNSANPRDLLMVVGDTLIESASPLRYRHFEVQAYRHLLKRYFHQGARWLAAPPPSLRDPLYDFSALAHEPDPDDDTRSATLGEGEPHTYPITEFEPVFEAADFVRCGRDIFVTRSIVTNEAGITWVRRHLGPEYRVHILPTRCRHPWHIDTTFLPLAPGKALINPHWMGEVPKALKNWKLIPAPEPLYPEDSPMAQPRFTSQWLSMNVLSLNEKQIFVEESQTALLRLLEAEGFEPIPLAFDAVCMFGGSFHCVTVDVRRRGGLQDYCT